MRDKVPTPAMRPDIEKRYLQERVKAEWLHPYFPTAYVFGVAVVQEEAGELQQASNEYIFFKKTLTDEKIKELRENIKTEGYHVLVTIMRFLEGIEAEQGK